MGSIAIEDLAVWCRVGVEDAERSRSQKLLVSVTMEYDFTRAALADDVALTIDYAQVATRLLAFTREGSWRLIERLATEIAELILREFEAESVRVTVRKFVIAEAKSVAVEVDCRRAPFVSPG